MQLPIKTQRLAIAEFDGSMSESVHLHSLDEDNRRFVPDEVFETAEDAREILSHIISWYEEKDAPLVYAILLSDGRHIGHVQAVPLSDGWEIGYHVAKPFTGKGYATEAVNAFLPQIMRRLSISKIYGICHADNIASRRVLEKCGFRLEFEGIGAYHGAEERICRYVNHYEFLYLEKMGAFFDTRVDGYNAKMLSGSGEEDYKKLGACFPKTDEAIQILNVGCGTGIELDYIWKQSPNAQITCIDISRTMLDLLLKNHLGSHDRITIAEASYIDWPYPANAFDIAVSNMTMHHLRPEEKAAVYRKILSTLKAGGVYIEGDFIVKEDGMAEQYKQRYEVITANLPDKAKAGEYHIDIPCTLDVQKKLLQDARFCSVEVLDDTINRGNGAILKARK